MLLGMRMMCIPSESTALLASHSPGASPYVCTPSPSVIVHLITDLFNFMTSAPMLPLLVLERARSMSAKLQYTPVHDEQVYVVCHHAPCAILTNPALVVVTNLTRDPHEQRLNSNPHVLKLMPDHTGSSDHMSCLADLYSCLSRHTYGLTTTTISTRYSSQMGSCLVAVTASVSMQPTCRCCRLLGFRVQTLKPLGLVEINEHQCFVINAFLIILRRTHHLPS